MDESETLLAKTDINTCVQLAARKRFDELNGRQRAFIVAYTREGTPTFLCAAASARVAGYAEDNAGGYGYELLKNKNIKACISDILKDTLSTREDLLKRTQLEADGVPADCYFITANGKIEVDFVKLQAKGLMSLIKNINYNRNGDQIIEFESRQKAKELLGKFHRLWSDGAEVAVSGPVNITYTNDWRNKANNTDGNHEALDVPSND